MAQPRRNGCKLAENGSVGRHRPGWKTKAGFFFFFFPPDRGFLAKGADPSPSTGPCQAALISPSSGEDNACLGRGPPVTSARACQREAFALYCSQMLFVSLPGARAPAETRGACRGEMPRKTPTCPKMPLRQLPSLQLHWSGEAWLMGINGRVKSSALPLGKRKYLKYISLLILKKNTYIEKKKKSRVLLFSTITTLPLWLCLAPGHPSHLHPLSELGELTGCAKPR